MPFGKTTTYGNLAKAVNSPKGARAVGLAMSKNPVPIVVPAPIPYVGGSYKPRRSILGFASYLEIISTENNKGENNKGTETD